MAEPTDRPELGPPIQREPGSANRSWAVLGVAGIVIATVFASVAALAGGPEDEARGPVNQGSQPSDTSTQYATDTTSSEWSTSTTAETTSSALATTTTTNTRPARPTTATRTNEPPPVTTTKTTRPTTTTTTKITTTTTTTTTPPTTTETAVEAGTRSGS